MRLTHLTLRSFMTAFDGQQVDVDFDALPPGLIAIVGPNGAGKSTLLEAGPAAVYRAFMSRGDLATYAMDRDSFLEAEWDIGGRAHRARVNVDGVRRATDAVLEVNGVPWNDGKATTFDREVAKVFPPLALFKASAFAAQDQSGAFTALGKKERRELFAGFLGADRLIRLSDTARMIVDELTRARVVQQTILTERRDRTADWRRVALTDLIMLATSQQEAARVRGEEVAGTLAILEARLGVLAEPTAAYEAARLRVATLEQRRAETTTRLRSAESRRERAIRLDEDARRARLDKHTKAHQDLTERIQNNELLMGEADAIRAAALRIAVIDTELTTARAGVGAVRDAANQATADLVAVEKAVANLDVCAKQHASAAAVADSLTDVPCGGAGEYAACPLIANAVEAQQSLPGLAQRLAQRPTFDAEHARLFAVVAERRAALAEADAAVRTFEAERQRLVPTAAKLPKLEAAEARIAELRTALATLDTDFAAATAEAGAALTQAVTDLAAEIETARRDLDAVSAELATATADLAGVRDLHAQAEALHREVAEQRAARDAAVANQATATERLAGATRDLAAFDALVAELPALEAAIAALDTEILEWGVLAKALGREGIPDLEIDAAGPGISAITNDLLQACFDGRFSVELVTQVPKADGKGMKDEFTVQVTDNLHGDVRDIRDLSGGEQVIVAEALMNAIAIYVNERSATPMRTCFRDETTGALSPENTDRYMAMLRAVQARGGFHQVLFISHAPAAQAVADAQLHVGGGRVEVVVPPYGEAR